MPEEILYFIIRLAILFVIGGSLWLVVTQIALPLLFKMPLFPVFNKNKLMDKALIDIREYQRKQLESELEEKKAEVEMAAIEIQIQEKQKEIERIKNRKIGDKN